MSDAPDSERLGGADRERWRQFRDERQKALYDAWSTKLDEAREAAALAIENLGTPKGTEYAVRAKELSDEFQIALAKYNEELDLFFT